MLSIQEKKLTGTLTLKLVKVVVSYRGRVALGRVDLGPSWQGATWPRADFAWGRVG